LTPNADMDRLYKRYRNQLTAFFLAKRLERSQAEDFVQDVFLRYQQADYAFGETQAGSVLFKIARNIFFDHLRRTRTRRSLGVSQEQFLEINGELDEAEDAVSLEDWLDSRQRLEHVLALIQALPPKCREVFIDFRFREMSQKDIARTRGISVSMVERHVATAVARLKSAVDNI